MKGPTCSGEAGKVMVSAVGGLGMGTVKSSVPPDMVAGVAPVMSSWVCDEPVRVDPSAEASLMKLSGSEAVVW